MQASTRTTPSSRVSVISSGPRCRSKPDRATHYYYGQYYATQACTSRGQLVEILVGAVREDLMQRQSGNRLVDSRLVDPRPRWR